MKLAYPTMVSGLRPLKIAYKGRGRRCPISDIGSDPHLHRTARFCRINMFKIIHVMVDIIGPAPHHPVFSPRRIQRGDRSQALPALSSVSSKNRM